MLQSLRVGKFCVFLSCLWCILFLMMQSLSVWGIFHNCSPEVKLSWEEEGSFTEMFFDYAMCHIVMRDMLLVMAEVLNFGGISCQHVCHTSKVQCKEEVVSVLQEQFRLAPRAQLLTLRSGTSRHVRHACSILRHRLWRLLRKQLTALRGQLFLVP
jgi:hypothetical protein